MIYSHPNKPLEEHTNGVLEKYERNCSFPIGRLAVLFHDLGKLNPNFQKKVLGKKVNGYSNHAYLSVIVLYNFIQSNQDRIKERLEIEDLTALRIAIWQLFIIIAHHHGNLPDLCNILNKDEIDIAGKFSELKEMLASSFIKEKLGIAHDYFELGYNDRILRQISTFDPFKHGALWQENVLSNFVQTQFSFACLIEADKRDAGNNAFFQITEKINTSNANLAVQLEKKFNEIDNSLQISDLNKIRTSIRKEATQSVIEHLQNGKRLFSLPAPTGAGKTFSLLAVANEIIRFNPKLGITYILPFLSITDQVQNIVESLNIECFPITSKSENKALEKAQLNYDNDPSQENLDNLLKQSFSENTFDHPFILTTFVQFFETLVSNRNATLLKLPNFSNRVFLIDEVQAIPPRLYIFFAAWLEDFCKKHNSFIVFSTATMPKFSLPYKNYAQERSLLDPKKVFKNYSSDCIAEIINPNDYFNQDVFNRYKIDWIDQNEIDYDLLIEHVIKQNQSCLIILNTINDTKYVFKELKGTFNHVILLNTHFVIQDRTEKINEIKNLLDNKEQVVVVSTQLIEAGVDVDFPIVYRDLCPLPSLVQSAGRCNRNKILEFGQVYLFILKNHEGKKSAELVYRKEAKDFIQFCQSEIQNNTYEKDLFDIQSRFFDKIKDDLTIGDFVYDVDRFGNEKKYNFISCINNGEFEKMGKFQLILENQFGESYQYFIPENIEDKRYEYLVNLMYDGIKLIDLKEKLANKKRIESVLKQISNRLLTIRIKEKETAPSFSNPEQYFGIRVLSDLSKYSKEEGIELGIENCFL